MPDTYLQLLVWKRPAQGAAVVYICFQRLGDGKFAVQNVEFFRDTEGAAQWQRLSANTGELFMDVEPAERCEWFETLGEAVAAHDGDFGNS